jgi:glycosyltransferase involved in cell wall biosynthesis
MQHQSGSFRPVLILAPGIIAGAEKVVLSGLEALTERGLNPLMVVIRESRAPHYAETFCQLIPSSIEVRILNSKKAFDLTLPAQLKNILSTEKMPLLFHTHGFKALITVFLAEFLKRSKSPHIHTHHGNTSHTLKVKLYELLAMLVMKRCTSLIAVSHKMKVELKKKLGSVSNIYVVENMLALKKSVKFSTSSSKLIKINHEIKDKKIKLLYLGRLSPEKGLLPFLQFLSQTEVQNHFELQILGDGVEKDLALKFIRNSLPHLNITLVGYVYDPTPFIEEADMLIMPSLREGLPLTIIEALANGIPILANDVGAISSLVRHRFNGYLTNRLEFNEWDRGLKQALIELPLWKENAQKASQDIENHFSASNWGQKTHEIYQSAFLH